MTEKTSFSDLISANDEPLPNECCATCRFGVRTRNPQVIQELVECRAHPRTPVVMPTAQGPAMTYQWPIMRLSEKCGDFLHFSVSEDSFF